MLTESKDKTEKSGDKSSRFRNLVKNYKFTTFSDFLKMYTFLQNGSQTRTGINVLSQTRVY